MIIKMCREHTRFRIVGRMLYRCKIVNIFVTWHDHNATWMLSSGSFYARAFFFEPNTFCGVDFDLVVFHIFLDKSIRRLVCHRTDRSRTEYIIFSKKFFGVFMRSGLIFARKVEVDVGFFVAFESKKNFKRNVMSFFLIFCAAVWTFFVWQIHSRCDFSVFKKLAVLALFTNIVRRKWIYLGDVAHCRCKR